HHGVPIVPVPRINHLYRWSQAKQQLDVGTIDGDPLRCFLRIQVSGTEFAAAGNCSNSGRKLFVIPGDASLETPQLLAGDPSQDCVGKVVDLLVWGKANLWMGFKLGGKPGGAAFGRANSNKIDLRH